MPIKESARKALRQSQKRAEQNTLVKNVYKKAVKNALAAIEAGKDVAEVVRTAQQSLDKAAKRGVIKSNTAARKLSRLMKKAHTVGTK